MRLAPIATILTSTAIAASPLLRGTYVADDNSYTNEFGLDRIEAFTPHGGNAYMSLEPGTMHRLKGVDDDESVMEVVMTVTDKVVPITFDVRGVRRTVLARAIEEREWIDGRLVELTTNFYARDIETSNIYYFGEDVAIYEPDGTVSRDGQWRAGQNRALPGLYMPASFLMGSRYQQEIAPGSAMDRADHVDMNFSFETPIGNFNDCVMTLETTPIEPDEETTKVFAPGIGLLFDDFLTLVEFRAAY